ncbi:rod shape-determining protein MreC [Limnochorda pilosa]|uniref:Cell shape-determining protein MreC n=1 Tax=Limnochorda pilosa TaxID=1555112 RepID=A0A0K2SNB0_LIMPI|nr:rod shape-determining protein MreC [Limnochorda pilosa]BAS28618.1 rod shape-determining protein MreC [Limnochorda pilosa]
MRFSWRAAALILVLLALSASIYATARDRIQVSPLEWVAREGLAPVQAVLARTSLWLDRSWDRLRRWRALEEENERLREQLEEVENHLLQLSQLERENQRLRAALGLQARGPGGWVAAEVIARSPNQWLKRISVSRGSADGIRRGLPVVTPDGLVGKVTATTAHTADVTLLTHTASAVGARTEPGGELVLVEGNGSFDDVLRVRPIDAHANLQPGEVLVTSGLSSIYAPGIPIGRLTRVETEPYGLSQTGYATPFVDFQRLNVVQILLDPGAGAEAGSGG